MVLGLNVDEHVRCPISLDGTESSTSTSSSSVIVTADDGEVSARYARKHTTMQIGLTSLRDFFDELGFASDDKCTKAEIVSAYMTISTREHLELEEPAPQFKVTAVLAIRLLQHKVFLGNVKLADFLRMIKFDEGQTSGASVIRALEESTKKDAELGILDPKLLAIGRELD